MKILLKHKNYKYIYFFNLFKYIKDYIFKYNILLINNFK